MKRFFSTAVILALAVGALSSCTKKYYDSDGGLSIDVAYYPVNKNQFRWNGNLDRWEYSENDDWLDKYQLDDLEMSGTVIFGDDFCPMPYVDSYYVGSTHVVQNTGYEATYGRVTFYIQTNEKDITWSRMNDRYEFKLSLFYWR